MLTRILDVLLICLEAYLQNIFKRFTEIKNKVQKTWCPPEAGMSGGQKSGLLLVKV